MSFTIGLQTTSFQPSLEESPMARLAPLLASSIQQTQEAREKSARAENDAHTTLKKTIASQAEVIAQLQKEVSALKIQKEQSDKLHQAEINALKQLFQDQMTAHQEQTATYFKELQQNFLSHVHQGHDEQPVFVTKTTIQHQPNPIRGLGRRGSFIDEHGHATNAPSRIEKTYSKIPENDFDLDDQKRGS
jgi:hypothetical protein